MKPMFLTMNRSVVCFLLLILAWTCASVARADIIIDQWALDKDIYVIGNTADQANDNLTARQNDLATSCLLAGRVLVGPLDMVGPYEVVPGIWIIFARYKCRSGPAPE